MLCRFDFDHELLVDDHVKYLLRYRLASIIGC